MRYPRASFKGHIASSRGLIESSKNKKKKGAVDRIRVPGNNSHDTMMRSRDRTTNECSVGRTLPRYVTRLEAVPPGQQPTSMSPTAMGCATGNTRPASSGWQHMRCARAHKFFCVWDWHKSRNQLLGQSSHSLPSLATRAGGKPHANQAVGHTEFQTFFVVLYHLNPADGVPQYRHDAVL